MMFKKETPIAMPPQKMSDKAVAFGQHIVDLEEALTKARMQIDDLTRRTRSAEDTIKNLRTEKTELRERADDYQRRWIETQTKLRTAGNIILDAIAQDPAERYQPKPAIMRGVEKALGLQAEQEARAIPEFLNKSEDKKEEETA